MTTPNQLRLSAMEAIHKAGNGHPGGVLSCMDILHALYFGVMAHEPRDPHWPDRDRFIMSKGHCAVAQYVVLAHCGYFSMEWLDTINNEAMLGEHAHRGIPGIDVNTGSLGHGLGLACGIAYAAKLAGQKFRTFVLLGDAECWEGSVWEAAMFAAHHELNITAIVDRNMLAIRGNTEHIIELSPIATKWDAFGWATTSVDGHDSEQLAHFLKQRGRAPNVFIADTVKGKGVSFMEGIPHWHHGGIDDLQMKQIRRELGTA